MVFSIVWSVVAIFAVAFHVVGVLLFCAGLGSAGVGASGGWIRSQLSIISLASCPGGLPRRSAKVLNSFRSMVSSLIPSIPGFVKILSFMP